MLPQKAGGFNTPALVRAGGIVLGLIAAGLIAFFVTAHIAAIGRASITPVPLPPASTPSASPASVADVARAELGSTVTVETDRTNELAFGTGWLFDAHGDFVTNAHVVAGRLTVRITDRAGRTHDALVLGADDATDVAMLRVTDGFAATPFPVDTTPVTPPLPVADLASSRATGHDDITTATLAQTGQDVPLQPGEVQSGSNAPSVYHDMLEITGASVYMGNSGGPVVNDRGAVVGILTLASPSAPEAFAIPLSRVYPELSQLAAKSG